MGMLLASQAGVQTKTGKPIPKPPSRKTSMDRKTIREVLLTILLLLFVFFVVAVRGVEHTSSAQPGVVVAGKSPAPGAEPGSAAVADGRKRTNCDDQVKFASMRDEYSWQRAAATHGATRALVAKANVDCKRSRELKSATRWS